MTTEEKAEWFDVATRFSLGANINLVMKSRKDGISKWAIIDTKNNKVLNSNFEWEDEPPSANSRDEAFLIRTRFDFETAVNLFQQFKMFSEEG